MAQGKTAGQTTGGHMDDWLEYDYEDRNGSWEPLDDAEEFERNQLALDREWDEPYDGDEDDDGYEYDPDLENELV